MTDYTKPVDIGPGYATLKEAMIAEGIHRVSFHDRLNSFTVVLNNGAIGGGQTPREAITDAKEQVA